jgi:hypothetical protein
MNMDVKVAILFVVGSMNGEVKCKMCETKCGTEIGGAITSV